MTALSALIDSFQRDYRRQQQRFEKMQRRKDEARGSLSRTDCTASRRTEAGSRQSTVYKPLPCAAERRNDWPEAVHLLSCSVLGAKTKF